MTNVLVFAASRAHFGTMIFAPVIALLLGVLFYNRTSRAAFKVLWGTVALSGLVGFVSLLVI